MLETVREYALERLVASGQEEAMRDAHAAYFVAFGEHAHPNRIGEHQRIDDRLRRLEDEHANLRAALTHLKTTGDADRVLQLSGSLAVFWHLRGHFREARHWLEWVLDRVPEEPTAAYGRGRYGLGLIDSSQGFRKQAMANARASLVVAEALGDTELAALSLHLIGVTHTRQQQWDEASDYSNLALERFRALGQRAEEAAVLLLLGQIAEGKGDTDLATDYASRALGLYGELGHSHGAAMALALLGKFAAARGDEQAARSAYGEALRRWVEIGERWWVVQALTGLAALAAAQRDWTRAALLVGAIDARCDEVGSALPTIQQGEYDRAESAARKHLGADDFATAVAAGRTISLSAVLTYPATAGDAASSSMLPIPPGSPGRGLSPRERAVLALLVQRYTDPEIAAMLFLSPRTVNRHVSAILAKLDVASRREAAAVAVRLGLI